MGYIAAFGFNFAPKGWMLCAGQILSIQQYSALFALLGTTYGGNGTTTFALPDLRSRTLVGMGNGPGLNPVELGERAGVPTVTLLSSNLPAHIHTLNAATLAVSNSNADGTSASGGFLANTASTTKIYAESHNASSRAIMGTTDIAGNNAPLNIQNPYLGINYSISLVGIYPSRN